MRHPTDPLHELPPANLWTRSASEAARRDSLCPKKRGLAHLYSRVRGYSACGKSREVKSCVGAGRLRRKGGTTLLETVGVEPGYGDVLESVAAAAVELGRHQSVPDVAEAALDLALRLTHSSVAFLALLDEDGRD